MYYRLSTLHEKDALTQQGSLCVQMTLQAMPVGVYTSGKASHVRKVKE